MESLLMNQSNILNSTSAGYGATVATNEMAGFLGVLAGVLMGVLIAGLIVAVLTIIAWWRIFEKAGEKGWKSLIPFYNTYILFKITGRNFWKWLGIYVGILFANMFSGMVSSSFVGVLLSIVAIVLWVYFIIELVKVYNGLSKRFGHGTGFTVGLLFLNTIFMLILAFEKNEYNPNVE